MGRCWCQPNSGKGGRELSHWPSGNERRWKKPERNPLRALPPQTHLFTTSLYPGACFSDTAFRNGPLHLQGQAPRVTPVPLHRRQHHNMDQCWPLPACCEGQGQSATASTGDWHRRRLSPSLKPAGPAVWEATFGLCRIQQRK